MDVLTSVIKALPRVEGAKDIRLPGERSAQLAKVSAAQGLYISNKIWNELTDLAHVYGIAMPHA